MSEEKNAEQEVQLSPSGVVPELYIDGFQGVMVKNGVAKLNLFSDSQMFPTGNLERRVVARLTMPAPVLLAMHEALKDVVEKMRRDGVLTDDAAAEEVEKRVDRMLIFLALAFYSETITSHLSRLRQWCAKPSFISTWPRGSLRRGHSRKRLDRQISRFSMLFRESRY